MSEPAFKVAHLMPFSALGGTEIATLRAIEASRPYGVEHLAFFFESCEPPLSNAFREAQVPSFEWERPYPSLVRRSLTFLKQSYALARELKRRRIDLVHCADVLAAYSGALAGRMAGLPVLSHVRCLHADVARRDQYFLRPVNHFAFVAKAAWESFAYPVPPHRGTLLYDGIAVASDAELRSLESRSRQLRTEFGIPPDATLFAMFGHIQPPKDYETLIRAAADVIARRNDAYFLLCGRFESGGSPNPYYLRLCDELAHAGLSGRISFTGFRTDVRSIMASTDVLVHSTNAEGFGLAILEGMALAKPVVGTAVGGVPELVKHGVTGWLSPRADAAALAAALLEAAEDPQRRQAMGSEGRKVAQSRFSDQAFARNLMALYRKILGREKAGTLAPAEQAVQG